MEKLSRGLTKRLRHGTDFAGTKFEDELLWFPVEPLLCERHFADFAGSDIEAVIQSSINRGLPRFESRSIDGLQYIRATSGHSNMHTYKKRGKKRPREQPENSQVTIYIHDALTGAGDFQTIVVDRTWPLMVLRALVAKTKKRRPHLIHLLDQGKPVEIRSWGGTLETVGLGVGVEKVNLQVLVKEDELVMFLRASYDWLSQHTSAPSIEEFKKFIEGAWQDYGHSDITPVQDAGKKDRKECLAFVWRLIEDLSKELDAGDRCPWSNLGSWANLTVEAFLEAAEAACENRRDGLAGMFRGESASSWIQIEWFFYAGKTYE